MEFEHLPIGVEFDRETSSGTLVRCFHAKEHRRSGEPYGTLCSVCKASWRGDEPALPVRMLVRLPEAATLF